MPDQELKLKEMEFEGYKFSVDMDKIDDVDALDMIDEIENKQRAKVVIDFLVYLLGNEGYASMKAYFVEKDGRFRMSKLADIYQLIFKDFDPKD